jgi:hypothetical protein
MGGIWKRLEIWTRESPGRYKQSFTMIQQTRILTEMQTVKTVHMSFQMRIMTLWKNGLEAFSFYILAKNLYTFCPCPETSSEVNLKMLKHGYY